MKAKRLPIQVISICLVIMFASLFFIVDCAQSATTTSSAAKTTTLAQKTSPASTTKAPIPQYGGVLKIITNPGLMNIGYPGAPNASNDGSYQMPCLEGLLNLDPKGTGDPIPWLATGWQYSPDYKSITLTLRKGVKFHDGTDFNAAAAKFSLDTTKTQGRVELSTVSSIDIVNDYTLRLNLLTYDSSLLVHLASYVCPIVSPASIQSLGKDASLTHPVGTGPFKFVSYKRDVSLNYEKFADYWQKGKPYLDGIEIVFIADPVTALASLKAGEAHILAKIGISDAAALQVTGKYTLNPMEIAIDGIIGDSAHPNSPFADIRVRRAIAYAIDNATISKAVGLGFFPSTNQFVSPKHPAYNPAVVGYPYNPQKAKELLAQAGYPNGFETKLSFRPGAFEADFCTMLHGYLKAVGINVQLDSADPARFAKLRLDGWENQLMMYVVPAGIEKDMSFQLRERLSIKARTFPSSSVYIPADYNDKLLAINSERDLQKRLAMTRDVEKMAIDGYCLAIPIQVEQAISAHSLRVHDCNAYKYYGMNWHPMDAWLSK
jgi:ABC-type transport system substrate-binding protein